MSAERESDRDRTLEALRLGSVEVLRKNDAGGWTKASPRLYPHQWSWDAAFIAIGWAHVDPDRALLELERLLAAQWRTGKVPHIVFDEATPVGSYFPDWTRWNSTLSPDAPVTPPHTSGLCQPPIHALALWRIFEVTSANEATTVDVRGRLARLYPRLLAWHKYLCTERDPDCSGLVTIYHPWEGADNSPRWDAALAAIEIGDLPPYRRRDIEHVQDPSQRPTARDYDRYMWLVELLKRCRYDESSISKDHPFAIKDIFFSGVLLAANHALASIAELIGASDEDRAMIDAWIALERRGLMAQWDPTCNLCLDYDLRAGRSIPLRTFAGFAAVVAGDAEVAAAESAINELDSPWFLGHPALRWAVMPSTSPSEPAFESRNYWRGPTWPIIDWLLWRGLNNLGRTERAERLRLQALSQLAEGGLAEYFEPFTGEALGSSEQSWTAAVALDWLSREPR